MITVVVGKEIEKIKGEFESVINGMNMVGKIPYDIYSELFDVGTDCIQKAYELGKSELEKENAGRPKWHKVADGDLPKVGVSVVGFYYGKDNWHKVYLRADGHWCVDGTLCQPPYAWQEIVPPDVE